MNCTVKELYERKSVRAYTDEPITEEEKELILTSAIQAPTAGNMSLFSVIDVQSQEIKDILAERCDHQKFIASAPPGAGVPCRLPEMVRNVSVLSQ